MAYIEDLSIVPIQREAIEMVPESLARELFILPVAIRDGSIHVILAADSDASASVNRLQRVLDRRVTFDLADRMAIWSAIDDQYLQLSSEGTDPESRKAESTAAGGQCLELSDQQFPAGFLQYQARIGFRSQSCVSFELYTEQDNLVFEDGKSRYMGPGRVRIQHGWLDVHFPCDGMHKLIVRGSLPGNQISHETALKIFQQVCLVFDLPTETAHRIQLQSIGYGVNVEQPASFVS